MVGVLDTPENKMTLGFRNAGDVIYLIGNATDDICSSEYLHKIGGVEHSPAPHFDIAEEVEVQKAVAAVIAAKLVVSAHDVSEGGLFITLLESGFAGSIGFAVEQHDQSVRKDAYWFGEGQSRVVVSVNPSKESDFLASFAGTAVAVNKLGTVAGDVVVIGGQPWGNLQTWQQPYDNKIGGLMQ
jgi:phosphoribosylformylglycinamidine synthase